MAEEVAKELSRAKKHMGAASASITRLEENIDKLEVKPELSKTDCLMIPCLMKKLDECGAEFKKQFSIILDLMDDEEEAMTQEQAVFDEYDENITLFPLCLQELTSKEEAVAPTKPKTGYPHHLTKRLLYNGISVREI